MARRQLLAVVAAGALLLAACGGDDDSNDTSAASTSSAATEAPSGSEAPSGTEAPTDSGAAGAAEFAVNVDDCEDPDAATAPIEGDIKIGTSVPLSGGPAILFAPFADGFEGYFAHINETEGGVNGQQLVPVVKDDQYLADLTVTNVEDMIASDDVAMFSGIIGSPNNAAIQEDLNAQCIPQLWATTGAPNWGAVDAYPWTSGLLVPYPIEVEVWLEYAKQQFPDGGTAALFTVNSEFGQAYADAMKELAPEYGFEIVAEEKIEAADSGAPSGQMTNLVAADPDIILAVPLGLQCVAFMQELGNAKASNPEFDPLVYQTATCASPTFFEPAGEGADGVYTSSNVKNVNDPEVQASDPEVQDYIAAFKASSSGGDPGNQVAIAGWLAGDLTYHVIKQAFDTCGEITRECVMNAARNIDYAAPLFRPGLKAIMNAEDGYISEGTQIVQWSSADKAFVDQGDVIDLEGTLGVYQP